MINSKPDTQRVCDTVLELCGKYGLLPNPYVFSVLYTHVSEPNSPLALAINELLLRSPELSDYDIQSLYQRYFLIDDEQNKRLSLSNKIDSNVGEIATVLELNAENAKHFVTKLDGFGDILSDTDGVHEIQSIVSDLADNAREIRNSTILASKKLDQYEQEIQHLRNEISVLTEKSSKDSLTRVFNRGAFDDALLREIDNMQQSKKGFCLALADLDKFKNLNDQFGHQVGDQVLKYFANIMIDNTKGGDTVARYGGEEFAIILPDTELVAAHNLMVKIKHELQGTKLVVKKSNLHVGEVTASFGLTRSVERDTPETIISRADNKLYQAKSMGRNRVTSDASV